MNCSLSIPSTLTPLNLESIPLICTSITSDFASLD